jgi:phosphoglycolate phosphatase
VRAVFTGLSEELVTRIAQETRLENNRVARERGGELYPFVRELLPELSRARPLFIVSNCQAGYIEAFFDFTGCARFFRDHECWGSTGRAKAENLAELIARNALARPVYVGDTAGDQEAAMACGVPFVHARYGFAPGLCSPLAISSFAELPGLISAHTTLRPQHGGKR